MNITDSEVRRRLRTGEDSQWEFKQIEFSDDHSKSPRRDDLADEMIAFANAENFRKSRRSRLLPSAESSLR